MPEQRSWELTPREYKALCDVYDSDMQRWALSQAMFANAHFKKLEDEAFTADDFLGRGNRHERSVKAQEDKRAVAFANAQLARIQANTPIDEDLIPDWARGAYNG